MERTTISTDLLIQKLTDNELVAIIKYQSLWAMLERQPDDKTALRYMTQKQLIIAKSWADSIEMFVTSDINSINKKRTRQKKSYEKQRVAENSDAANKGTVINRINVKKNNKKEILQQFENWWAEYPNKKSKQDAQRIFEKLLTAKRVSFDELLAGAKAYAEHCRQEKTDPHYIKHPSTWLNQGCWADEYELSNPANDDDFYRKLEAL
nr:MAG TPA: replisome organizer protein [Caudoviricetes sp.]